MDWKFNTDKELWIPEPDIFEQNDSLDYIRKQKSQTYRIVKLPMGSSPITDQEILVNGNFLYVKQAPTNLKLRLNEKNNDLIDIYPGQKLKAKFYRVFLTTESRGEGDIIFYIGENTEIDFPTFTDIDGIEVINSLPAGSFPLTKTYKIGFPVKRVSCCINIVSSASPAKYLSRVDIYAVKYINGIGRTIFYERVDPTGASFGVWNKETFLNMRQPSVVAGNYVNFARAEFYSDNANMFISPDYVTFYFELSTPGVYSNGSLTSFLQRAI